MTSCTSPSASAYGLPISRVTSRASASLLRSASRPICWIARPRTGGGVAAHSCCASCAVRQGAAIAGGGGGPPPLLFLGRGAAGGDDRVGIGGLHARDLVGEVGGVGRDDHHTT